MVAEMLTAYAAVLTHFPVLRGEHRSTTMLSLAHISRKAPGRPRTFYLFVHSKQQR